MEGLRTLIWAAVLGVAVLGTSPTASAFGSTPQDLLRMMASCAGRYSATMEHLWIHNPSQADMVRSEREAFLDILAAIVPEDQARDVLNWRIDAKAAHAALLRRASRADDVHEATWVADQADGFIANCKGAILH